MTLFRNVGRQMLLYTLSFACIFIRICRVIALDLEKNIPNVVSCVPLKFLIKNLQALQK
jgi:hypothetical protein